MQEQKQKIHRIAILSDTHSLLRAEVKEVLQSCEVILHGGDIASRKTYEEIREIAPTYFVQGNADEEWAQSVKVPPELDIELYGFHFYLTHKKKDIRQDLNGVDVVIYGHSHKYAENVENGILYLNPGSCGPRRFTQPITLAVMTVDEEKHTYLIEREDIAKMDTAGIAIQETGRISDAAQLSSRDIDKLIRSIIKDMKAKRTVETIAKRNKIPVDFANQILQIYTTHPGIDVEGILNRMDIWGK